MHLHEIARVIGGVHEKSLPSIEVRGVSTDTRTLRPGDVFFALRGPSHDAHAHLPEAFAKGALAAVVDRIVPDAGPQIGVPDVLTALGDLAAAWRQTLRGRVVAVAGAVGKTTTKEMIGHLLAKGAKVHKAAASFNNSVGVPLTLLGASRDCDFVVVEVGTNHPGEIARLGQIVRPDIAVITSVVAEHLEGLGTLDGVAQEEASLLRYVRPGGCAVLNADASLLWNHVHLSPERIVTFGFSEGADLRPVGVQAGDSDLKFRIGDVCFGLGLLGGWNAVNAAAAAAVGLVAGVPLGECARRLADVRGPKMRMERLEIAGVTLVNDAYNSSPDSAKAAVAAFGAMTGRRRIAVIGDMKELGRESAGYHRELGVALSAAPLDLVVAIGPECAHLVAACARPVRHFASVEEARDFIVETVRPGDLVLLKGSRVMGLERVVKFVAEKLTQTRSRVSVG